ncbi:DgyrCDS10165 [Dimorphilus gyrociliatus]|uniref:DgyrCDS10165 n=1 Tax=Dimorphilus gyrociliatus TaxID=2664684 RepID=A0A7I8VZB1_9ANNE|nr:DgyrCDS10165 [Dimorphilus gyrociliatus]
MERWIGRVAVLTGPTEGMGHYLAKQLVECGLIVAGVARNVEKMKKMEETLKHSTGRFVGFFMDLEDEDSITKSFEEIEKTLGPVSALINMGSSSSNSNLLEDSIEAWESTINVNVLGPVILMKLAIKSMKKNNIKGNIINIGGTASYYTSVFQDYHFYSVSKFILRALGDALRMEFRANNIPIRICHVGPGHIKTGVQDRLGLSGEIIETGFLYYASEFYHMQSHKLPRKFPFKCDGDNLYHNNVLPVKILFIFII